jgi:hypothetical protein
LFFEKILEGLRTICSGDGDFLHDL